METLKAVEAPNSEKYAKIFSRRGKYTSQGNAIKSIEVKEMNKMPPIKILVTLWNGTLTTSSLPGWCCESENKDFIFYYVNEILAPTLIGHDPLKQEAIDKILDHLIEDVSLNELEKIARNVNWAMSVAVCKAGAHGKETSLYMYIAELAKGVDNEFDSEFHTPTPSFNITSGGLHLENRLADQHLVVLPLLANSFHDAIRIIRKIYSGYFKVQTSEIDDKNAVGEGDGGSYIPNIKDIKNCLRALKKIVANFGYEDKVSIGVNIGASKFYRHDKTYRLNFSEEENSDGSNGISVDALKEAYDSLLREFFLASLEDMFHMDDQEYSSQLTRGVMPMRVVMEFDPVSVDDMSNVMWNQVCNGFHLKVGQIGSVTKCITFVIMAKVLEWPIDMSSHDSCETSEPFIADFCVGLSLEKMKIGVSCITSSCNICNRVRELEIERAEEEWRRCPIPCAMHALARIRGETFGEERECCEKRKKSYFKRWGFDGFD